jgi:hypothetical protein
MNQKAAATGVRENSQTSRCGRGRRSVLRNSTDTLYCPDINDMPAQKKPYW